MVCSGTIVHREKRAHDTESSGTSRKESIKRYEARVIMCWGGKW